MEAARSFFDDSSNQPQDLQVGVGHFRWYVLYVQYVRYAVDMRYTDMNVRVQQQQQLQLYLAWLQHGGIATCRRDVMHTRPQFGAYLLFVETLQQRTSGYRLD